MPEHSNATRTEDDSDRNDIVKGVADYIFERPLWSGNHGTFWLARTPERLGVDEPHVAVKLLDQHASDDEFRRMTNELRLFAAVSSPHLVQLYDAGHHEGRLYYSSRFHPDGSLAAMLAVMHRESEQPGEDEPLPIAVRGSCLFGGPDPKRVQKKSAPGIPGLLKKNRSSRRRASSRASDESV